MSGKVISSFKLDIVLPPTKAVVSEDFSIASAVELLKAKQDYGSPAPGAPPTIMAGAGAGDISPIARSVIAAPGAGPATSTSRDALISTLNTTCSDLFPKVKEYLRENELAGLKSMVMMTTEDQEKAQEEADATTFENYPYPYDKECVLEFSQGRCQDSSKIMGGLLLNKYNGVYDQESGRFKVTISGEPYYLDYMIAFKMDSAGRATPTERHAFLKLTSVNNRNLEVVIDPSYKQFAAVKNPKVDEGHFYERCDENEALKAKSSVYVGTVDSITSYFREQSPKTKRAPADYADTLTIWEDGRSKNSTLLKCMQDVAAVKSGSRRVEDEAAIFLAKRQSLN